MNSQTSNLFDYALKSNDAWANYKGHQNPAFFQKAEAGQSPSILWLGCSDSRVPETTVLGLQPGDVFVHRNIANIISPTDINSMAVIEYAVEHLKVNHIMLCGHTCCGGATAALDDVRVGGVIDTWITPLRALRRTNAEEMAEIKDTKQRAIRLAELGVEMGVRNLLNNFSVNQAINERGLTVHGCIYDIGCGKIRNLRCGTDICIEPPASKATGLVRGDHGTLVFADDGRNMAIQ
ncbi:BgTH12-05515 [Blumeria graminis f. sp. triticale]|uniref:Carbonic anhydrase n=2 Tax=Blumeria graminis TaxID=34373 RepID=A0A061HKN2_BLUGR|nr:Carbonic anhydrase [Blumeria graminis f. sp. tritici 96224]CAD6503770.1 BgTH12-05515 [Blumeria graminis f. sp. triticale]